MTYDLLIADRAYSSWSLRAWLVLETFGLRYRVTRARLYSDTWQAGIGAFQPTETAPALKTADGAVIFDSLAIAEELADRHPDLRLWPADPGRRGVARSIVAEMHAGFRDIRDECPMALRVAYEGFAPSPGVLDDVARLEALWAWARAAGPDGGPWLFGRYTIADAFFAPIAARIATYALPVGEAAAAYVAAHLQDPAFRRWRAMALIDGPDQPVYGRDLALRPWPGPPPYPATDHRTGPSVNDRCPYSGDPVTHFLETDGVVYGFCNAFCRDKTRADPDAWPAFARLRAGNVNVS